MVSSIMESVPILTAVPENAIDFVPILIDVMDDDYSDIPDLVTDDEDCF